MLWLIFKGSPESYVEKSQSGGKGVGRVRTSQEAVSVSRGKRMVVWTRAKGTELPRAISVEFVRGER
jgi:hypothetical protein